MHNVMQKQKRGDSAGGLLRSWRKLKRISQLDLALEVGVSTKHLSFVENGKSQPSRNLILKMAQALNLALRHRNAFLQAAGYAAEYGEEPFDGQRMEIVRQALQRMLAKHEPYPALVVNTGYQILMTNTGFEQLAQFYGGEDILKRYDNVYRVTFAPDGFRNHIVNWPVIENFMLARLWEEAVSTQSEQLFELFEEMSRLRSGHEPTDFQFDNTLPVVSLSLAKDGREASFFTTITTFGTPLDLTTQELRIESFFPADESTANWFQAVECYAH